MDPLAWMFPPAALNGIWLMCLVACLGFWTFQGQNRYEGGRS